MFYVEAFSAKVAHRVGERDEIVAKLDILRRIARAEVQPAAGGYAGIPATAWTQGFSCCRDGLPNLLMDLLRRCAVPLGSRGVKGRKLLYTPA